jgi:hypothetical protein
VVCGCGPSKKLHGGGQDAGAGYHDPRWRVVSAGWTGRGTSGEPPEAGVGQPGMRGGHEDIAGVSGLARWVKEREGAACGNEQPRKGDNTSRAVRPRRPCGKRARSGGRASRGDGCRDEGPQAWEEGMEPAGEDLLARGRQGSAAKGERADFDRPRPLDCGGLPGRIARDGEVIDLRLGNRLENLDIVIQVA